MRRSVLLLVLPVLACSSDEPPAEASAVPPAPAEAARPDPCQLLTVDEWEAATGYTDIEPDRSARDVCDLLSDDMFGVVGSVSLVDGAFLAYMERTTENAARVTGVGDEAIAIPLGIVARRGDHVVYLMVNPQIEDQARIAHDLMAKALARL